MASEAHLVYDGVTKTAGWSFTYGVGVAPAQAVITMASSAQPNNAVANMVLVQTPYSIAFIDCRVARIVKTGNGLIRVTIQDRRWKWAFGKIDGAYNEWQVIDGAKVLIREKTPQELATLLLTAMGETGYSVGELPDSQRPGVTWNASNPAQELQSLCSSLGYIVVLNPYTDKVEIHEVGVGGALPSTSSLIEGTSPLALAAQPDALRVICGPVLFQSPLKLGKAVGKTEEGNLVDIDDLPYKPTDGWEKENPLDFTNVTGTYVDDEDGKTKNNIDLARDSVWKMYRITELVSGGWELDALVDTPYQPSGLDDIHIQGFQLRKADSVGRAEKKRLPAVTKGTYASKDLGYENTEDETKVKAGFSIDTENGAVAFSEPMFKYSEAGESGPADLTLHVAFQVSQEGIKIRHENNLDSTGTTYQAGDMILPHPEIVREIIEGYESETGGNSDNETEVNDESKYYLDAAAKNFAAPQVADARYARIHSITLDGVNRQVTWSGGGGQPAVTQVSQNQEHNVYVQSYREAQDLTELQRSQQGFAMGNPEAKR